MFGSPPAFFWHNYLAVTKKRRIFAVDMGTMTQKVKDMQARRIAYQKEKTKADMLRVANYMTTEEKEIFFSGNGFVRVPDEERRRQRIEVYPYLIP